MREARKHDTIVNFVTEGAAGSDYPRPVHHQGVIAQAAAYDYSTVEDILAACKGKGGGSLSVFLLDDIEDPHNLGAIIRTANLGRSSRGDHSQATRSRPDSQRWPRASAGALNYTPVAKVTNLDQHHRGAEKRRASGSYAQTWADELMYDRESYRPYRPCDRQRRRGRRTPCKGKM